MNEQQQTSQVPIDDMVERCRGQYAQAVSSMHAGLQAKFATAGIQLDEIDGLKNLFEDLVDSFDALETCHKQEKYFRDSLGLIVSLLQ